MSGEKKGPDKRGGWTGLLGFDFPPLPTDAEQRRWADIRRNEIELSRPKFSPGSHALHGAFKFDETKRDLLKVDFAVSRRINLSDPDWRQNVVSRAANEHPELDTNRKRKGRPAKPTGTGYGLFARHYSRDERADEIAAAIEAYRQEFPQKHPGKRVPSVRRVIQDILIRGGEGQPGERIFDARVKQWQNRISAVKRSNVSQ
jgi:hypothetical protein